MNSNNKFGKCCKCPALMDDTRLFTNYLNNTKFNLYVKNVNNITDENLYRQFLQNKGEQIINNERNFFNDNKRCNFAPFEPKNK